MKAAERIARLFRLIKQEKTGNTIQHALLRTSHYKLEQDITDIIDQETAAELARVKAEKAELVTLFEEYVHWVDSVETIRELKVFEIEFRESAQAAIAKHAKEGD